MKLVSPGDVVYSFRDTRIVAVGTATSHCYDGPKPVEFGSAGKNWGPSGWRVDVTYSKVQFPIRPKDLIDQIRPYLPNKYSPLQTTGDGLQSVYLAEVTGALADILEKLLGDAGNQLTPPEISDFDIPSVDPISDFEDQLEENIEAEKTEKEQLAKSRRGQGKFRENVMKIEKCCRVTRLTDSDFLIASHIKPWRHSDNRERLDGANGLMLTPNVDRLFDRGLISFSKSGELLIASVADFDSLQMLGIRDPKQNCGSFTDRQIKYLEYHRENVWLGKG
jgi:hypothetical protein